MTALSGSAFVSKWNGRFADNITREISEEDLREFVQDIEDSFINNVDFVAPAATYASLTGEPTDNANTVAWGNGLINTVRGGVATAFNTLSKWYNAMINGDFTTNGVNFYLSKFAGVSILLQGTNDYTKTLSLPLTSYSESNFFFVWVANTNTGPVTINLNSLGAVPVKKYLNQPLVAGDFKAGQRYLIGYDGTNFQVLAGINPETENDFAYDSLRIYNKDSGDNNTYAIYNLKYWQYINSTPASGQIPAEGLYWTEVSKDDVSSIFNADLVKYNGKALIQRLGGITLRLDGTDNYTKTTSYTLPPLGTSSFYIVWPQNTNTGAVTINLNGQGAKNLYKNVNEPLVAGDFKANQRYIIGYDGTNFQLVGGTTNIIDGGAA